MREYHSACNNHALKEFIDLENLPFGAYLSTINFPKGEQRLILVGQ
jgi:hypothetical protein